ncbi:hexose carrier protein [Penicillium canescens]|nr:hexose carrier protein [Penicillium canescens]
MGLTGRALRLAQIMLVVAPAFLLLALDLLHLFPVGLRLSLIDTIHTEGAAKAHNSTGKIGALIGALSCTVLSDRLGRRKTIFLGSILTIIGQVLQVSAYSPIQFTVGPIIPGMGVGQLSVVCQSGSRNAPLQRVEVNMSWQMVASCVPGTLSATGSTSGSSPRWLVRVNRTEEATINLAALKDFHPDDEAINSEISGIELSFELTAQSKGVLREIFSKTDDERLLYRFCFCIVLQFFQQMCGGNLISVYASTIFQENLNLGSDLSKILAACALTWKFLCCFIAFFSIDRLGRRAVFMISGAVRLRVAMAAISTANHWLWNFVVVMVTPVALDRIGYQYYIMYAVLSACIPVLVYFFYPETMNRNLEMLNHAFRDASSPWQIVSMARHLPQGEISPAELIARNKEKGDSCSVEMKENV